MSKKNLYAIVFGCDGDTYLMGTTESKEAAEKIKYELQPYIEENDWLDVVQTTNLDEVNDYKCCICLNCLLLINIFREPDKKYSIGIYAPLDLSLVNIIKPGDEYEDSIEEVGFAINKHSENHKEDGRMKSGYLITIRRPLIRLPQFASTKEKYNFFYDKALEQLKLYLEDEFPKDAKIMKEYFNEDGDIYIEEENQ